MSKLVIRYEPDPQDEVGRLWFDLEAERFSGTAFCWSNLSEMADIITKLGHYPLGEPARWQWGYNTMQGADLILGLGVAQIDQLGALEATVELADLYDTSQRLSAKLKTDYVALDALRVGLELMVASRAGEALLGGQ